jgi:predicted RNA-binding protein with PIN domain
MTTLVVDGYNAIHAIPETREKLNKSLEDARDAIISICEEYVKSSGFISEVKVVFDGDEKYRYVGKEVTTRGRSQLFSAKGKGDDKVIQTVKYFSARGKVIVASNDNYVRNNARVYGAGVMDVKDLVTKRGKKASSPDKDRIYPGGEIYNEITRAYRKKLGI